MEIHEKLLYDKLGKFTDKQLTIALKTKSGVRRNPTVAQIRAAISEQDITGCYSHKEHRRLAQ